ncbi:MAG: hypothetical protein DRP47_08500 [Candidatus Zixiibacteriota bacterium]|nr:MAG: hypothetical protein DRP47_08500 [candidate division Zixibacteria bacterium]
MYEYVFFRPFSVTGFGADTIGFGGYKIFLDGIHPGFDEVAFLISTSVDPMYDGYTLCLDSCFYPPDGKWLWSMDTKLQYYPAWDGPHCFTIRENDSITFSGHLNYLDPVPPDTTEEPMRGVRIEMWDDDVSFDDSLTSHKSL